MNLRTRLLATTVLGSGLLTGAGAVLAQEAMLPAVSAPNGKVAVFTGAIGDDFAVGATGSWAIPLRDQWGAQIDGLIGNADGIFYGVGGHLFWRDPSKGLLGVYSSFVGWNKQTTTIFPIGPGGDTGVLQDALGADVGKVGVEGEAYVDRISLEGALAYQFGTNSGVAGRATVAYYPTDDLRLDLGVQYLVGPGLAFHGGVEWAPAGHSYSLFGTASAAASNNWSLLGGVKFFPGGGSKSLIHRQREDDPDNLLPEDLFDLVGSEYCPDGYSYDTDDGGVCYIDNPG